MGLFTLFKRNDQKPAEPAATPDAVAQARTHARRRLIGATVLLAIGVVGFPLLFETQPRPVRMDIPIEIPRKDNAPPLVLPPVPPAATEAAPAAPTTPTPAPRPAAAASAARDSGPVITERAGEQGRELPAVAAKPASPAAPAAKPPAKAPPKPTTVAPQATAAAPAAARTAADEGDRARAILEGQSVPALPAAAAPASAPRVVIQVGAWSDADKLNEVRHKVEKLGLKTYIQVVEVDGEKRTRVRIGPFPTKAEADKTAARIKAAGLPVAILTL